MMRQSNEMRSMPIVLAVGALVALVTGILEGLRQDWDNMCLALSVSVLTVFFVTNTFTNLRASVCFKRVENRFPNNQAALPKANPFLALGLIAFMVITGGVSVSLAIVSLLHDDNFRLGIYLTACAIVVLICSGILATLATVIRCKRLEALISAGQEDTDKPVEN